MIISHVETVTWCPFMVSIRQNVSGNLRLCGGTVLTQTLTLTAAHCLIYGTKGLYLEFGSVYIFGGRLFEATKIILHKDFDAAKLAHDLGAASTFPASIHFSYNVRPVKLPNKEMTLDTRILKIYGWGATSDHKWFSEILRTALLPVVDRDICQTLLDGDIPANTFCLGYLDGHMDACLGDSGGPAMLGDYQVGITSFGEGCAVPFKPGVYTDLTKHLHWLKILETIH